MEHLHIFHDPANIVRQGEDKASLKGLERLCELFERGLDAREDICGIHGTSLLTADHLLKTGFLPPTRVQEAANHLGHIYFFPVAEAFPDHKQHADLSTLDEAAKWAAVYGRGTSIKHSFLLELGLDPAVPKHERIAQEFEGFNSIDSPQFRAFMPELQEMGISESRLRLAARFALRQSRGGVLLALHRDCLSQYDLSMGDVPEPPAPDMKIFAPEGLPLDCIAGIEPIGEDEYKYFDRLQQICDGRITIACT